MPNADKARTMRVGEDDYAGFQFWGADLPDGVTILSGTATVLPATGLTLWSGTAIILGGDVVLTWFTAVTAGEYIITFTTIFSDTKKLIRTYRITVS